MTNYIETAFLEAEKSPMNKAHGAVLVKKNKLISQGHNKYKQRAMTSMKDSDDEKQEYLRKRYRKYCRRTIPTGYSECISFYDFCRVDGRLAASIHAEEDAIIKAGPLAHGATLYVVRYVRGNQGFTNEPAMSFPCKRCARLCEKNKIKVFYTQAEVV